MMKAIELEKDETMRKKAIRKFQLLVVLIGALLLLVIAGISAIAGNKKAEIAAAKVEELQQKVSADYVSGIVPDVERNEEGSIIYWSCLVDENGKKSFGGTPLTGIDNIVNQILSEKAADGLELKVWHNVFESKEMVVAYATVPGGGTLIETRNIDQDVETYVLIQTMAIVLAIFVIFACAWLINKKFTKLTIRHIVLAFMAFVWLIPIIWLVATSFSNYPGIQISRFFPEKWTFDNYKLLLFGADTVAQFPNWFKNTFIIAIFVCIISTCFVLMVAYATSCMRFKARKPMMNIGIILGMFPGVLSMIAVYFVLKTLELTNSHIGLIIVYSASTGLGYMIVKGFFDTISVSLREAAKIEGASELTIFTRIVVPLSRPIIVYTVINSFLSPWMDFVYAKLILNSGISEDWTVAIGLYNMLDKTLINSYFARFCAGGVLVSIPISILFIIMQKFYVEGITGGATKG